jgi:hypothetical protein
MKKLILSMAMLLLLCIAQAQNTDQSRIVQLCVDLSELQPHYPSNPDGTMKAVHVMHRDVVLPPDNGVTKFGQPLVLMQRDQIVNNQIGTFLMFHEMNIAGSLATVKLGFVYGSLSDPHLMNISLSLTKSGEKWSISSTTIDQ